jgi:hypothetical protein
VLGHRTRRTVLRLSARDIGGGLPAGRRVAPWYESAHAATPGRTRASSGPSGRWAHLRLSPGPTGRRLSRVRGAGRIRPLLGGKGRAPGSGPFQWYRHYPAVKLTRLRDGDVLEDGDVVLVRGGDLDPYVLLADAVRYHSIYGISVFAVRTLPSMSWPSRCRWFASTAWLSCMSGTSSPRDELESTGRNPCHSRYGPTGTAGPPSDPARGRSRVSTAASGRGQLRLNGVIDVPVDVVVTDAPEDAVTR